MYKKQFKTLNYITIAFLIFWTSTLGVLLFLAEYKEEMHVTKYAKKEAIANFNKDIAFRNWVARRGGVYVSVSKLTQPNPYLSHIPDRDIEKPSGEKLTLMNPAYILKQIMEEFSELYGVKGRITSLKPLNPSNAPDEWEKKVLKLFELNELTEIYQVNNITNKPYLRYMQAFVTKKSCLKCHAHQGYKVGEIRGGVSVSVPLEPYLKIKNETIRILRLSYGSLLLLGLVLIVFIYRVIKQKIISQNKTQKKLEQQNNELRQAHQELIDMRDMYAELYDFAPNSYIMINKKGIIQKANLTFSKVLGIPRNILLNQPLSRHVEGEDQEVYYQHIRSAFETKKRQYCELRLHTPGDNPQWFRLDSIFVKNTSAKSDRLRTILSNVTERKLTEDKLLLKESEQRDILNTIIDGVITIDGTGRILTVNQTAENTFGYSADEMIGKNVNFLMPEPYTSQHDGYLQRYLEKGEAHIIGMSREVEGLHKNNKIFPMRLAVAELPKDDTGKRRFIGSCHDLTEQKQQQEQLSRSQKMDALGQLTGGIAHDYNNMLNVILGYTELLQSMFADNSKASSYLNTIMEAGERSKNMNSKLLSFSRKKTSSAQQVNLNELVKKDEEMLAKTITVRIELKLDLYASPWLVWFDQFEFQDVLLNLSINAQHAMPDGGVLTFTTLPKTLTAKDASILGLSAGDYLRLSIIDTGTGMDADSKERIFDPFFSTKGDKGTGLGLSQVFGFVQRSGGAIHVESQLGQGTQFDLYFPRYQSDDLQSTTEDIIDNNDYTGNETILVVDDEPVLREMAAEILSQSGYQVRLAEDGEQALAKLAEHTDIKLVLSDVIMPKMDGFQFASEVAKYYPHIKIQMVSGFTSDLEYTLEDQALFQNILYKPYNNNELLKRIWNLLNDATAHKHKVQKRILSVVQPLQPIQWSQKFNTSIDEIDADHKIMVSLFNRCIEGKNNADPDQEIKAILHELQNYLLYHIKREECIMKVCDYPNLANHQQVHQLLITKVNKHIDGYELGKMTIIDVLDFFWSWLNDHVMNMDKAIKPYCQGKQTDITQALNNLASNHLLNKS